MREKAIKIKRKRCASDWFLDIFKVVFLVLVTVICVYPFWNIFVVSINDATDALRGGLYFLPRKLSLASYKDILGRATFLHGILITVLRTAIGTPLAVLVTTALAYVLSRKELLVPHRMGFDQFLQADARRPGLPGKMGVRRIYYDLHKAQHRTLLRKQPDRDRHFHGHQRICGFACSVCIRPDRVQRKKSCDADVRINAVHPVDLHQLPNLPAAL